MPYRYEYTVTGTGTFPYDMLRYDSAWPARTEDSVRMSRSMNDRLGSEDNEVTLASHKPPTEARWHSFGWRLVPLEMYQGQTVRKFRI